MRHSYTRNVEKVKKSIAWREGRRERHADEAVLNRPKALTVASIDDLM